MSEYSGINTLANIADAAYQKKTAEALKESNAIAKNQTKLLAERNEFLKAESLRRANEAAKFAEEQNKLIKEGNRQKAESLRKEHLAQQKHRNEIELLKRKEQQRKDNEARREQSSRQKKSLLFDICNDAKKVLNDPSYSGLDKYINLCAAAKNIETNKIDHTLTDDFQEKDIVQNMIDEVNNKLKTVYDNFSNQDRKDHDLLLKILETDEELEIKKIEDDIDKKKLAVGSAQKKIQKIIDSEIDNQDGKIYNIEKKINTLEEKINMSEGVIAEIQKINTEYLNSPLNEIASKFNNFKKNSLKKELNMYLKSEASNLEMAKKNLHKGVCLVMFRKLNK